MRPSTVDDSPAAFRNGLSWSHLPSTGATWIPAADCSCGPLPGPGPNADVALMPAPQGRLALRCMQINSIDFVGSTSAPLASTETTAVHWSVRPVPARPHNRAHCADAMQSATGEALVPISCACPALPPQTDCRFSEFAMDCRPCNPRTMSTPTTSRPMTWRVSAGWPSGEADPAE